MKNLTKDRFIELASEVVEDFASVNGNVRQVILDGTPYNNVKNLFYMQPFSTWDEEARNEVVDSINGCEHEFVNIEEYSNREPKIFEYTNDLNIDMENNDFKSAECSIEIICDYMEEMINEFKEQFPDINFDMPRYFNVAINSSAKKFDVESNEKYKLNNEPKEWDLDLIAKNAPAVSILDIDGEYFIASNLIELNQFQVAYAYYEIDENIPKEILNSLDFDSKEAKGYLFTDELKGFITNKELFETEHSQKDIESVLSQSCGNNVVSLRANCKRDFK